MKNKGKISRMEISNCAFSSKLAEKWLRSLKRLKISFCDALKVIFLFEKNHGTTRFNSLIELELYGLRNLVHIWLLIPKQLVAFRNLELLVLSECHNSYLFSPQVAKLLVQLQKIYIGRCAKMEEILLNEDEAEEVKVKPIMDTFIFPQLKVVELQRLPSLGFFYSGIHAIELPLLESLRFNECNKMKSFSYGSLSSPMLKKIQINGSSYTVTGDLNATMKQ
ncbi:hypothetical protein M5689_014188 [Euphorbia peplus]|nr:hypothetical protein M5689_014188 [Euphorbia peplus]